VIVHVDDATDSRLADYVALTDPALRRRVEPAAGVFIAEGEKVIRRAVAEGYVLRSLLLAERWVPGLEDVIETFEPDLPVLVASNELLRQVTGFHVHRGALAAVERRAPIPLSVLAAHARRLAVLEDLVDPSNVGAVFRAAAALGMDGVILSRECADPLYRRSVRVSMGAVLSLPYARFDDAPAGLRELRSAGFRRLALTPDPQAVPLAALPASDTGRCALLLGTEGDGLSEEWLAEADVRVRIPMARGIDSLNVASAAAVAFYGLELGRRTLEE
jgi:tRNA G18 (ribose-2'-O)-methylase SpoU